MIIKNSLLILHLSVLLPASSFAAFGDFADPSYDCPATTTCPIVCVQSLEDCPTKCDDNSENIFLCEDGHCVTSPSECDARNSNPCESNACGFNVACPAAVMAYDDCSVEYQSFYDNASSCPEESQDAPYVPWNALGFVFWYAWISFMTLAVISWCYFNEVMYPRGETKPLTNRSGEKNRRKSSYPSLEMTSDAKASYDHSTPIQLAYRKTFLGQALYSLTIVTLFSFQALLATAVAFYYAQQDGRFTTNPFKNDKQVLAFFEMIWFVGIFWTLCLKWPTTIESLFWRRCTFDEADIVAVLAVPQRLENGKLSSGYIRRLEQVVDLCFGVINCTMSRVFPGGRGQGLRTTVTLCAVSKDATNHRSITYQLRRYNYAEDLECFIEGSLSIGYTVGDLLDASHGLTKKQVTERRLEVGNNVISVAKPSLVTIVVNEFNGVFYLWQNYILWTWMPYGYWPLGLVNTFVYVLSGLTVSYIKYRNELNLFRLSESSGKSNVLRDGKWVDVPQLDLVPGDVVQIETGTIHCDVVLLESESALVDESALTGEATPVAKCSLDPAEGDSLYTANADHKKATIAAGTNILEASGATAVVTKSGSQTAKGKLLKDILFYESHKFKFDVEIRLVLAILIFMAPINYFIMNRLLGPNPMAYKIYFGYYVVYATIPALLPTVFVASVGISSDRLNQKRIACSQSRAVLVSGKVKMAFFDKTGTLTKQGLDFMGASHDGRRGNDEQSGMVRIGMATCHTLTKTNSGLVIGHFVDKVMFDASAASDMLHEKDGTIKVILDNGEEVTVLKRFEFDHHRMTQSVIVQAVNGKLHLLVKGSPESIGRKCCSETLPAEIDKVTRDSAKSGVYQLALASKSLPEGGDQGLFDRDSLEDGLVFRGLLNFKNVLREETPAVLQEISQGDVRPVMVTGDNIYTGIHIARESGLIRKDQHVLIGLSVDPHGDIQWLDPSTDKPAKLPAIQQLGNGATILGVTGEVWSHMQSSDSASQSTALAPFIKVYGRCTPNDKVSVVSYFVRMGVITMMCGDGGNDCGALKTAHVGIALSDAEASIVAPFTALDKSITSVRDVLKEGRCCLANAFASYKYMINYGQSKIIINFALGYFNINFGYWNWIMLDGFFLLTMSFSLLLAKAKNVLASDRPTSSLLGRHTMSSTLGVMLINYFFLVLAFLLLFHQDFFQCREWSSVGLSDIQVISDNYESAVLYLVGGFFLVQTAFSYNFGFFHRAAWYRNVVLIMFAVGWTVLHFYITLVPSKTSCFFRINCENENVVKGAFDSELVPIQNAYNTTVMPLYFRWTLVAIMGGNALTNVLWECCVVNGCLKQQLLKRSQKQT